MGKEAKEKDPSKIGVGKFIIWNATSASSAINVVLLTLITVYCTNAVGLSAAGVGTCLMLSKIFDGVTDLVAGYIVDNTNTKIGRGRPYDLCIVGLWICTYLMFSVPAGMSTIVKYIWLFVTYALCQSVFRTFLNAASVPYMVRVFNEQQYVKLSSWGGLFTTACVLVFNVIFPTLYAPIISSASGWSRLVLCVTIPMIIIGIMRFLFIPEKYVIKEANSEHITLRDLIACLKASKNIYPVAAVQFVLGISSNLAVSTYYFLYVVGNVSITGVMSLLGIVSMLTMVFYPWLLKHITTKQLIQLGYLLMVIPGIVIFIAKDNLFLLAIAGVFTGASTLPGSYMSNLLNIDCADYNEVRGLSRMEGTLTAITGLANKIGAAFGTFLTGILLTMSGFDGTLEVQPDSAIMMIRCCYSIVPALFAVLAAATLMFYKLDKKKPEIQAALAEKRANDAAAAAAAAE